MSLFDLRDVCMVIGSLATLDLPMVIDLIGIFVLKGPYCTLTMIDWFLQALSVIPRGSWGDVAMRFTMIRWASPKMWFRSHTCCGPTASCIPEPLRVTQLRTRYDIVEINYNDIVLNFEVLRLNSCCDWLLLLVVASTEEQENDIRTATEEDQQQLRNLVTVIHFRSGGSISCLNTQHDTWNSN
ncbi:hypothetical protein F511_32200 [Dorcoceras hygrometricum]|uniref:Uncharacterized protein n=1 Tax=Dorcoceras hygrometricum TaxID=472368 RepID=A0A2Z7DAI5_9LAMI|nr:hypothetical protein F511_32200 [Dorcoceras hygrometricum]